jgi:beta-lactam-binding protein with PASTA domain
MRTLYPDGSGAAELTCTVTNTRALPTRAKLRIAPTNGTARGWLLPAQDDERDFRPNEAQQFKVGVKVPADAPPGTYGLRVDMANVANPQEDFTEGDVVAFTVAPCKLVPGGSGMLKWRMPVIVAATLLIAGGIITVVLFNRGVTVPKVVDLDVEQAGKKLTDAKLTQGRMTLGFKLGKEKGKVIDQKPGEGERLKRGGAVELVVQGEAIMPKVTGELLIDAVQKLRAAGIEYNANPVFRGEKMDSVVSQSIEVGQKVPTGTTVLLGVEGTRVPALKGLTIGQARQRLRDARLNPTINNKAVPAELDMIQIGAARPEDGTLVLAGASVDLEPGSPNAPGQPIQAVKKGQIEIPADPQR